jgi:hypothetical protein
VDSRILKFVSRAEHLSWRARWKNGRWVKLSWTPEERSGILRQDEAYRQADARWQLITVLSPEARVFSTGDTNLTLVYREKGGQNDATTDEETGWTNYWLAADE